MKKIQVFEPAMCCSTGVCGPSVDPALVRFAGDMEWLKRSGIAVERHNLSQQPQAFVSNELVRSTMTQKGVEALPLTIVDGQVAYLGVYPTRAELAERFGLSLDIGSDDLLDELPMIQSTDR
jgi:hypothetical protein